MWLDITRWVEFTLGPLKKPPGFVNVLTSYLLGWGITENIKINYEFSFNQNLDENNSWNENKLKNFFQGELFSFQNVFHENIFIDSFIEPYYFEAF